MVQVVIVQFPDHLVHLLLFPLGGLVHAGIDFRKGVSVYGKFLFHGAVVDGPQVTVVKRRGIPAQSAILKEVIFILFNQFFIYFI